MRRPPLATAALALAAFAAMGEPADAGPAGSPDYALDRAGRRVVSISNLYPDGACSPALTSGRIVRREVDRSDLVTSVVLESRNGSRETVSVSLDRGRLGASDRARIAGGLREMLRVGRTVDLRIRLCGAGGRIVMLDGLHAL